jgi:DNA integrity scanning protein DisA with diadenylate cyclase activity
MFSKEAKQVVERLCTQRPDLDYGTIECVLSLALEIKREGREGRSVGTMFVVADTEQTLKLSKCLILDPLWYHPVHLRHIATPELRETLKELAQLDGAFIVANNGEVLSACRYINVTAEGIELPLGLGSRHMAAASITRETKAVAIVASESRIVRLFHEGIIMAVFR